MILRRVLNWATFSCEKASEMIEKRTIVGLSSSEKIKLSIHTSMCKACKSYVKESEIIEKTISQNTKPSSQAEVVKSVLTNEFKSNIISKLDSNQK